jgi:hypothetical protein
MTIVVPTTRRQRLPRFASKIVPIRRINFSISPPHLFPAQSAALGRSPVSRTNRLLNIRNLKMSNDVTTPPGGGFDDDGFSTSSSSPGRGHDFLRWDADEGWIDRDGVAAPSPMLVVKVDEILRKWTDNSHEDITAKPLPAPDELNAKIPINEWKEGVDGKPRPPWAHHVVIDLVNPATATKYVYAAATVGAHIAYEQLKENVITMRMLRGARVMPLVKLSSRPMRTKYRMSERPHFEIIGWHTPGGDAGALAPPTPPQLPSPSASEAPPAADEAPQTVPSEPKSDPISSGPQPKPQHQAKPKPPVNATFDALSEVKPATSAEILDDDIPW